LSEETKGRRKPVELKSDDWIREDYSYPDTIDLIGQLRPPRARLINVHDNSRALIVDVRRPDANTYDSRLRHQLATILLQHPAGMTDCLLWKF